MKVFRSKGCTAVQGEPGVAWRGVAGLLGPRVQGKGPALSTGEPSVLSQPR